MRATYTTRLGHHDVDIAPADLDTDTLTDLASALTARSVTRPEDLPGAPYSLLSGDMLTASREELARQPITIEGEEVTGYESVTVDIHDARAALRYHLESEGETYPEPTPTERAAELTSDPILRGVYATVLERHPDLDNTQVTAARVHPSAQSATLSITAEKGWSLPDWAQAPDMARRIAPYLAEFFIPHPDGQVSVFGPGRLAAHTLNVRIARQGYRAAFPGEDIPEMRVYTTPSALLNDADPTRTRFPDWMRQRLPHAMLAERAARFVYRADDGLLIAFGVGQGA